MKKLDILNGLRDTEINIKIRAPEVNREFKFKICKKTRVKEICNRMSELLNLDPIRTNVSIYGPYSINEMGPSSTLLQNGLEEGSILTAKILYTGKASNINTYYKMISKEKSFGTEPIEAYVDEDKYPSYGLKTHAEFYGIKAIGVCTNPRCIAYNKEVTFPFGCGTFSINEVMYKTKCQACPYRDKDLNKPIIVQNITLTNCYWKLEGHYYDASHFYNHKSMKNWIRVEGVDLQSFQKELNKTNYTDPIIHVKAF